MKRIFSAILMLIVCAPALAVAEESEEATDRATAVLEALDLPLATQELRAAGVTEANISEALTALRPAKDEGAGEEASEEARDEPEGRAASRASRVLRAEAETAREHGPMDNFGSFVREEVEKEVRGQELAESIRARREGRTPARAQRGGEEAAQQGEGRREAAGERQAPQARDRAEKAGQAGGVAEEERGARQPERGADRQRPTPARQGAAESDEEEAESGAGRAQQGKSDKRP